MHDKHGSPFGFGSFIRFSTKMFVGKLPQRIHVHGSRTILTGPTEAFFLTAIPNFHEGQKTYRTRDGAATGRRLDGTSDSSK